MISTDEPARCWLKSKRVDQGTVSPTRGHGTVAPKYLVTGCPPSRWGTTFIIAVLLGMGIYIGGGTAWGGRTRGAGQGLGAHPHYKNWLSLRALCEDGLQFAKARRRQPKGYKQVAEAADEGARKEKRRSSKGAKKEKKEKKREREAKAQEAPGGEAAAPGAAAPAPAAGTAAGDGGRWVHVPN